jgi:cardiolipin synthase
LIPIIGHITFLFLGRKNISQVSKTEYEKEYQKFSNTKIKNNENISTNDYYENKISSVTQRTWKQGFFKIYKHGFESYKSLFKDIESAKHHIHIQMYIVKPSETYDQFKSLLIKKVKEGVEVRMMLDDFGK